jgi:hypothetical protein
MELRASDVSRSDRPEPGMHDIEDLIRLTASARQVFAECHRVLAAQPARLFKVIAEMDEPLGWYCMTDAA